MRIATLFTVLITALTMRRRGFVRRYIRAVRVIRASIRTFPSTLDHSRARLRRSAGEMRSSRDAPLGNNPHVLQHHAP